MPAAIDGGEEFPIGAGRETVRGIEKEHIQPDRIQVFAVILALPGFAAITGRNNDSIVPDGPAVLLVGKGYPGKQNTRGSEALGPGQATVTGDDDVAVIAHRDQLGPRVNDIEQQAAGGQRGGLGVFLGEERESESEDEKQCVQRREHAVERGLRTRS